MPALHLTPEIEIMLVQAVLCVLHIYIVWVFFVLPFYKLQSDYKSRTDDQSYRAEAIHANAEVLEETIAKRCAEHKRMIREQIETIKKKAQEDSERNVHEALQQIQVKQKNALLLADKQLKDFEMQKASIVHELEQVVLRDLVS